MADSGQHNHNPHDNPDVDMDSIGTDTSQTYFETMGNNMHPLVTTAHQSPQQQVATVAANSYGPELWHQLLQAHDPSQQQAQQLYTQAYGQGAAGFQTDWPTYANTYAS